jgi:glycosyltransferase involved in cell wall biosynthesis
MRKVLIISYYWPPAGGIGVHRCLKFTKYLRSFGWEPVVYAPENAQYPYLDPENEKDIPEGINVIRRPIREPFKAYRYLSGQKGKDAVTGNPVHVRSNKTSLIDNLAIWIRGNFFIPDARSLWIKPSVKYLTGFLKENPVDAILSDGPPHTNTVIACRLSKKLGIPWLADFQDPWTQIDYHHLFKLTSLAGKKHREMEQEAFKTARKITIASPTWKKDLESIGAKNVDVIFWGYDEEDFSGIEPSDAKKKKFIISHAGLLGFDRNPENLFKALSNLSNKEKGFKEDLSMILAGSVDFSVKELIERYGLNENTEYLGQVSRKKVLQLNVDSSILLLPLNKAANAKGRIPGKLFEYLRAEVPILALGPEGSDVSIILDKTGRGNSFIYDDPEGIENYILTIYQRYRKGRKLLDRLSEITEYDVKNQTGKVAKYLDQII